MPSVSAAAGDWTEEVIVTSEREGKAEMRALAGPTRAEATVRSGEANDA
jgi:hypothetical protein